jgi:23S rRNA (guanosine2251-2'-O)-methyltransferase
VGRRPRRDPRLKAPRSAGTAGSTRRHELGGEQVEGVQAVRELLLAGRRRVHEVLLAAPREGERLRAALADIAELAEELKVPVRTVGATRLDAVARTDAPQGVVARAAPLPAADVDDLATAGVPFLVALDGVTDPGNLGAVLRTAECLGATGAILPRHRTAHVTAAVAKAAAGAIEHLPIAVVPGLPAAIERLKGAGVWVVGLDMAGDTAVDRLDVADGPVCVVLGSEGAGLSRLVRQRCDVVAAIALSGRVASLNVSTAAAIVCHEVARRRSPRRDWGK